MFRTSWGHLQADILKHTKKYTDHVQKGDLASYGFCYTSDLYI